MLCIGAHVHTISKVFGINEKNMANKDYISEHKCERRNVAAKCTILVTVT